MKNLYNSQSKEVFKLSRSKIDLFLECPKCFYLDRKFGISRPPIPAFTLNSAVDALLKKEFDIHRAKGVTHPLMEEYGIEAVPLSHQKMSQWRNNFEGVQYLHQPTGFLVFGAVDDIWVDKKGQLMVVDYKATSTNKAISLDDKWKQSFKKQMEVYQWLLRQNGFDVSNTGYFVYCNGRRDKGSFDGKLEFDVEIIPYNGDDKWVEKTLWAIKRVLNSDKLPESSDDCEFCKYRQEADIK